MFTPRTTVTTLAIVAAMSACAPEELATANVGNPVALDWQKGQSFHLAASYRRTNSKTEEMAVDMNDVAAGIAQPTFGESFQRPTARMATKRSR